MKESYRIDELAKAWDTSYWTILRLIHKGKLKAFKLGSTWRIKAKERERYEESLAVLGND